MQAPASTTRHTRLGEFSATSPGKCVGDFRFLLLSSGELGESISHSLLPIHQAGISGAFLLPAP